jgi:Holliday junction DNA helicase RuvA
VEKEFLQVFTSVSGLGIRKALKAMQIPVSEIASAIEYGDESVLKRLPDIGPKTAKKIIAELQGKMSKFALLQESVAIKVRPKTASEEIVEEAKYVLTELLHYSEKEAVNLLNLASEAGQTYATSEELLQAIFKMRASRQ